MVLMFIIMCFRFLDVWSAGCVVAELLLGQPIFPGDSGVDQLVEIIKVIQVQSTVIISKLLSSIPVLVYFLLF